MCNNISAITLALILLGGECAYSESRPGKIVHELGIPVQFRDMAGTHEVVLRLAPESRQPRDLLVLGQILTSRGFERRTVPERAQ
jgi:hypothetical protein